jgi:hypothetical protein
MTQQNLGDQLDRKMTSEEFTEVITAISEGKYSWACVLILRIAGYNPLHYIPYRTYNRLVKDNLKRRREPSTQAIADLEHLEDVHPSKVRGGSFQRVFTTLRTIRI